MKSKYYTIENRQLLFFTNKVDAAKVTANFHKIPTGYGAYHLEYGYPDEARIAFHLDTWQRMGNIIKEIP
jgi:hypothetical protein